MWNRSRLIFLILVLVFTGCLHRQVRNGQVIADEPWAEVLSYAQKNLPKVGSLVQRDTGYGYIKLDDRYIHDLFPLLRAENDGFEKPPYFRRKDAPGAHISVFYENENIRAGEVGQQFNFSLKRILVIEVNKWESYIVIQVDAPELEKLRTRYGLQSKLRGHEFHITIAKRTKHKDKL